MRIVNSLPLLLVIPGHNLISVLLVALQIFDHVTFYTQCVFAYHLNYIFILNLICWFRSHWSVFSILALHK